MFNQTYYMLCWKGDVYRDLTVLKHDEFMGQF